jgi:hypothetical protein
LSSKASTSTASHSPLDRALVHAVLTPHDTPTRSTYPMPSARLQNVFPSRQQVFPLRAWQWLCDIVAHIEQLHSASFAERLEFYELLAQVTSTNRSSSKKSIYGWETLLTEADWHLLA